MALEFLAKYLPSFSGSMITTLIYGIILIGGITILIFWAKNKLKYKYYGLIFKRRQEGFDGLPQAAIVQGKAGYFRTKTGKSVFRIKWGIMPWMKSETSQLPDPKYMMGNTVILLQVQKDNYAQAKIDVNWDGKDFILQPIDDSLKYDALLELKEIDDILNTKKMSPVTVGLIIMGLIIVTGIIVFYFLGKA